MKPEISMMILGLAVCIEDSIKRCFNRVFESKNAILAAVSMPKFKLKWVEEVAKKDQYKQMFIDEMRKCNDETAVTEARNAEPDTACQKKDFFDFESDEEESSRDSIEGEAAQYFAAAKQNDCLHKFPTVKKMFLKYNATIPSSGKAF